MGLVLSSWSVLINSNGGPNISVIKFTLASIPLLWRDFIGRQIQILTLLFVHCLHLSERCGDWYLFRFMSLLTAGPVCVFRWIPKWKLLGVRGRMVFITPPLLIWLKIGLGLSSSLVFFPLITLLLNLVVLFFFLLLPFIEFLSWCSSVCHFYSCRVRSMDGKSFFCGCSPCSRETKQKVSDLISRSDTLRLVIPDVNCKAKFLRCKWICC